MCVVSMVGDQWSRTFPERWPEIAPEFVPPAPVPGSTFVPIPLIVDLTTVATKEDIDKLRAEFVALTNLLRAALKLDEVMGQPHCETAEKVELLRALALALDVDIADLALAMGGTKPK